MKVLPKAGLEPTTSRSLSGTFFFQPFLFLKKRLIKRKVLFLPFSGVALLCGDAPHQKFLSFGVEHFSFYLKKEKGLAYESGALAN